MKAGIAGVRFGLGEWMMKRKCLRIVSVVLGISLLLSTAGCKKKKGTDATQGSSDVIPDLLPTNPDGTPHGDYVLDTDPYFSDSSVKLLIPESNKDRAPRGQSLAHMVFLDNSIACMYDHLYDLTEAEKKEQESLDVFKPDELMRFYDLLMMQYDCGIVFYSYSGEMIARCELPSNYEIMRLYPLRDGLVMANCFRMNYNDKGDGGYDEVLILLNEKGEILREEVASPLLNLEVANMEVIQMENGQFLFYGDALVYLMDENWQVLKKADLLSWESHIYEFDGKYYEISYERNYNTPDAVPDYQYRELDLNTFSFSDAKALDPNTPPEYRLIVNNGEVITDDGEGLVKVNLLTGDRENLFRWGETDIYGKDIMNARVSDSGDIILLAEEQELILLHKEASNPYAGKRILKVGINEQNTTYYPMIRAYNKRPESLGRVYVYFPDRNPYGFNAALKADAADRLLLDMKSGDGPDILLDYSVYGQFNQDGILEDLNSYIDGDHGLNRSLYYDNVFRAFEDNGKLFQMPMTFEISALVGDKTVLGEISGWTPSEFGNKLDQLPDGMNPLLYFFVSTIAELPLDSTGILLHLLYRDMGHYVDYGKEEVYFDSEDFRKLLEVARRASPTTSEETLQNFWSEYAERTVYNPFFAMMEDRVCAITPMDLDGLYSFAPLTKLCGGNAELIGWPVSGGNGVAASAHSSVGISAFSGAKEEAWDFVKYLMTSEAQMEIATSNDRFIFVNRECEEAFLQKEIDNYDKSMEPYANNPEYLSAYPRYDQEMADAFTKVIESISTRICKNPTIMEIIREEAPAYFDGSKSAEDVSKIIQSRASTLIAEMG